MSSVEQWQQCSVCSVLTAASKTSVDKFSLGQFAGAVRISGVNTQCSEEQ